MLKKNTKQTSLIGTKDQRVRQATNLSQQCPHVNNTQVILQSPINGHKASIKSIFQCIKNLLYG